MEMIKLNYTKKVLYTAIIFSLIFISMPQFVDCDDVLEPQPKMAAFNEDAASEASKPPVINALAAVVLEESTGRMLFNKNALEKRSVASTTKVMTALVALENGNPDDKVTVSKRAAAIGGSRAGLVEGEQYLLRELIYAMMMISANDAAIAVAEHIGGSVENFADIMNSRAISLGAVNSHFITPHGLDREDQFSTAYDIALIAIEALKYPLFRAIVATTSSYIPGHSLYNTNELLGSYPGADGVKTGYTGKAGRCLVSTAKKNGMRLITVVLGSPTRNARANASMNLLDYGFDNFSMHSFLKQGDIYARVPVNRGIKGEVLLKAERDIVLPLSKSEAESINKREYVPDILNAPVYAGTDGGYVEYMLNGKVIAASQLVASDNVRKTTYADYLKHIVEAWGGLMHERDLEYN